MIKKTILLILGFYINITNYSLAQSTNEQSSVTEKMTSGAEAYRDIFRNAPKPNLEYIVTDVSRTGRYDVNSQVIFPSPNLAYPELKGLEKLNSYKEIPPGAGKMSYLKNVIDDTFVEIYYLNCAPTRSVIRDNTPTWRHELDCTVNLSKEYYKEIPQNHFSVDGSLGSEQVFEIRNAVFKKFNRNGKQRLSFRVSSIAQATANTYTVSIETSFHRVCYRATVNGANIRISTYPITKNCQQNPF